MYNCYLDLLKCANEFDVSVARAQAKKQNLRARLSLGAFGLPDRQFIKRYRLSKVLAKELITEITPHMPPTLRADALDVETKVKTLHFFSQVECLFHQ